MAFQLRTVDRTKIYTSIVDQIVEGIRTGAFEPGAALPPERALAEQLGVSRTSVREAIRVLEHAGVLDVRTGSGTFVTSGSLSSTTLLRARTALEGEQSPLDLVAARRALEPTCAESAALARHESDVAALIQLHEEHQQLVRAGGDPRPADVSFHVAIAVATHNSVLHMLMDQVAAVMRQATWQAFTDSSGSRPGRLQQNLDQHRVILEAIERKAPDTARQAMLAHLADVEVSVLVEAQASEQGR